MQKEEDAVRREEEEAEEEEAEEEEEVFYYGERQCQGRRGDGGKACTNRAYYAQPVSSSSTGRSLKRVLRSHRTENKKKTNSMVQHGVKGSGEEEEGQETKPKEEYQYLCGVHAKDKVGRRRLPKRDPKERKRLQEQRLEEEHALIEEHRQCNAAEGRPGSVVLERLRMMRAPQAREGYLRVFPNFKHQNRADGFGCMRLSPKALGPVEHGQPGLPPSLNIENFHQGTKVFAQECDGEGNPSQLYVKNRLRFYQDPVPHRHKYKGRDASGNKNIPLYFLWVDRDGSEHRLSYIESRQFYCTFYERLASQEPDLARLLELMKEGTNLQICGYDAQPLPPGQTVEEAYLDPSTPFGHERVLYTMLLYHDHPEQFPWRIHKTFEF